MEGLAAAFRQINRKFIVTILIIIIGFSTLATLSITKPFLYTKQLTAETILLTNGQFRSDYHGRFLDSGNEVATVFFRSEKLHTSFPSNEVIFSLTHAENVELDSMTLKFKSPTILFVYLKTNDPQNILYSFSREPMDTFVINVEDFRWLGKVKGSAHFDFILQTIENRPNDLLLSIDIAMHYKTPIQLTGLNAQTTINMRIPNGEPTE